MKAVIEKLVSGNVAHLEGRLDTEAAKPLEDALNEALDSGIFRLVVDMSKVDYISSACLRIFVIIAKRVKSEDGYIELTNPQPEVRKVFMMVGLNELLPMGNGAMEIIDVLKQTSNESAQAMRNVKFFLADLFDALKVDGDWAQIVLKDIFKVFEEEENIINIRSRLTQMMTEMGIPKRVNELQENRPKNIYKHMAPLLDDNGSIVDVGCGDGRLADLFAESGRTIQLVDTIDYSVSALPFQRFDGEHLPFDDKSFDYAFLVMALHGAENPANLLSEAARVARKKIIALESVYLNESQRRFNMFFDWFFNCILQEESNLKSNFNSPEGWENIFRKNGLNISKSIDIGLENPAIPSYLWLFTLDLQ